jgi:hypothetical protein
MTTRINQPVKVLAAFDDKRMCLKPLQLIWNSANYRLGKVDFFHATKNGAERIYHFSLCDEAGGTYMKLAFHTHSLVWMLEEVEG